MKYEKGWIRTRLREIIYKAMSMSFITWVAITYIVLKNNQPLDLNYYAFTAVLVGLKIFKPQGK